MGRPPHPPRIPGRKAYRHLRANLPVKRPGLQQPPLLQVVPLFKLSLLKAVVKAGYVLY